MTVKTLQPSGVASVVGAIDPDAYAAATYTTGWVDAGGFDAFLAVVMAGTLGSSATLTAKIEVSYGVDDTARNANAADLADHAITTLTQAGTDSDKQALINVRASAVRAHSTATAYTHIRLSMTVGVATSDAGALLLGFSPRYTDGAAHATTVDEVI